VLTKEQLSDIVIVYQLGLNTLAVGGSKDKDKLQELRENGTNTDLMKILNDNTQTTTKT
jgi:hypothetical protein